MMKRKSRKRNTVNSLILASVLCISFLSLIPGKVQAETITARSASNSYGDVFLGGTYIEVGVSKSGSFGTSTGAPSSFHSHARYNGAVGLISDGDGWDQGAAPTTGDFFLPGTPEERYILGYYYNGTMKNYSVADRVNVSTTNWKVPPTTINQTAGNHLKAVTTGITAENIRYTQTVEFEVDDKEFLTTIEIENTGSVTITDCRFVRSFDPDQDQYTQGTYQTYNKVISNPRSTSYNKEKDVAMVVARGEKTLDGYFFAAFDQRARASRGVAFSPTSAYMSGLWTDITSVPTEPTDTMLTMSTSNLNGYKREDNAIALTFSLGNLTSGSKVSCEYYSSLDPNVIASLTKLKAKFANVSANEKDHSIGPFEMGTYAINDGTATFTIVIPTNDVQLPMQGTDRDGKTFDFAGKTLSIVLKGDGVNVDDSDPQELVIPPQFNYEGILTVKHGDVPENIRLAAAIIHLQMLDNGTSTWSDISTKVIIFNKNKQTQNIPYSFQDLWVRWMDAEKPDYQYRIVVDADNYKGANIPTSERNVIIEYTTVKEEKTRIERTTIVFDDNGGVGGTGAINLYDKKNLPGTIEVPTREGYDFKGYYKSFLEGTRYYDEAGKKLDVDIYDRPWETAGDALAGYTLYAIWEIHRSTVTIDTDGGIFSGESSYSGNYGESITLPNPTRDGYTFLRWVASADNCIITETLGANYYQFGPKITNVTIKAVWFQDRQAVFEKEATVQENIECEQIGQVFRNVVSDTSKGITEEDFHKGEIIIKVSVTEAGTDATAVIAEIAAASDEDNQVLKCYDISVDKTVNGDTTQLVELPSAITVAIPLTGNLADQNGYAVYRIHEGVSERLSASTSAPEYYEVVGDVLYIHTKRFSTYGVVGLASTIQAEKEFTPENDSANGNVYARCTDGSNIGVYKIDIAWGTMKYDFTKNVAWNPEMHRYEYDISLDELSAYDGVNNKVLITNHSNADVRITATISNSKDFDGIGMRIKTTNDESGEALASTDVSKVTDDSGYGVISTVAGYVRLDAMMNVDSVSKFLDPEKYYRVGVITIAIEALDDSYTPMTY